MIEKIRIWFWRWFCPERYVAHIVRTAMENVERVQGGGESDET